MSGKNFDYNSSLVKFIRSLDDYEFKLLIYLFNEVYQQHDTNGVMLISNSLLFEVMGLDEDDAQCFDILNKTLRKILSFRMENSVSIFNIIFSIRRDLENGFVIIEISPLLRERFNDVLLVTKNSSIKEIHQLGSYHSALLYWNALEIMAHEGNVVTKAERFYSTAKTKELFNVKETEYRNKSHFNTFQRTRFEKNVIEKSIKEVNLLGPRLQIEYVKEKENNKVQGYRFIFKRK